MNLATISCSGQLYRIAAQKPDWLAGAERIKQGTVALQLSGAIDTADAVPIIEALERPMPPLERQFVIQWDAQRLIVRMCDYNVRTDEQIMVDRPFAVSIYFQSEMPKPAELPAGYPEGCDEDGFPESYELPEEVDTFDKLADFLEERDDHLLGRMDEVSEYVGLASSHLLEQLQTIGELSPETEKQLCQLLGWVRETELKCVREAEQNIAGMNAFVDGLAEFVCKVGPPLHWHPRDMAEWIKKAIDERP